MPAALITIAEAREIVRSTVRPLGSERVTVDRALSRVLDEDVHASSDVPPFPCSAMDGYAIKAGPAERTLAVVAEARAGTPSERTLGEGEAIRISTGAPVPSGAEGVIRQEDVEQEHDAIVTRTVTAAGSNVRAAGEDQRAGDTVLRAGALLGAPELGAAVSAG